MLLWLLIGQVCSLYVPLNRLGTDLSSLTCQSKLFGSSGSVSASLRRSSAGLRSILSRSRLFSSVNWKKFDVALRLRDVRLLENAAKQLGVPVPLNAPRIVWTMAWRLQNLMLPILHFFDRTTTVDTCLNLAVLWWKSIAGDGVCFDLLPGTTRWIVASPLRYLYPRLHHQNVAMRTQFLDKMLIKELQSMPVSSNGVSDKTAVIMLGAGFDSRSIRFLNNRRIGRQKESPVSSQIREQLEFYELDLPSVIDQKIEMLERYARRNRESRYPVLIPADLNNVAQVQEQLTKEVFKAFNPSGRSRRFKSIIIMTEAVLMYLDKEQVAPLLEAVISLSKQHSGQISFAFSDRIPGVCEQIDRSSDHIDQTNDLAVTEVEKDLVSAYLKEKVDTRMKLVDWVPKPGRARHQGLYHITSRRKESMDELYPRVNII